jgi:hypothetical protein
MTDYITYDTAILLVSGVLLSFGGCVQLATEQVPVIRGALIAAIGLSIVAEGIYTQ